MSLSAVMTGPTKLPMPRHFPCLQAAREWFVQECLDHSEVSGEAHLRRVLTAYAKYYNDVRTFDRIDP